MTTVVFDIEVCSTFTAMSSQTLLSDHVDLYLAQCEQCHLKKKIPKRGLIVGPILSHYMNSRCQVDLIDMQSEPGGYY